MNREVGEQRLMSMRCPIVTMLNKDSKSFIE